MNWEKLLSTDRLYCQKYNQMPYDNRTEYQKDIDRIIFSTSFRRLQNKSQVFPLPDNDFVHTRLTHSIEVASIGRSLGKLAGEFIIEKEKLDKNVFHSDDFSNIVVASCMAHDLGNPPFGHSGEKAIGNYFLNGKGKEQISSLSETQSRDFENFEGNAAGLRILTNDHPSSKDGGLRLSYATLGSFIKYPTDSLIYEKKLLNDTGKTVSGRKSQEKFGYFQSEKNVFKDIAEKCGLIQISQESSSTLSYCRHPLTFLMEAADTICFQIIDLEDGHKVGLLDTKTIEDLLYAIIDNTIDPLKKADDIKTIEDVDEMIGALRSKALRALILECIDVFKNNYVSIMNGTYDKELTDEIISKDLLTKIKKLSRRKLYQHSSVVEVEVAGYEIMGGLLETFVTAVLSPARERSQKIIQLLPEQFICDEPIEEKYIYKKVMKVVDFVSRMTDGYAVNYYRKIKGIELPSR